MTAKELYCASSMAHHREIRRAVYVVLRDTSFFLFGMACIAAVGFGWIPKEWM